MILSTKENNINTLKNGYRCRKLRAGLVTIFLMIITFALSTQILVNGTSRYPLEVVFRVLMGEEIQGASFVIRTLNLPRMLAGLLVGISFGIAGSTFQTILRNPLASPDIIGITAGSSVGAMVSILILNLSGTIVSIIALLCGISIALLIYMLSKVGGFSGAKLILIGIGIQAMLNSVISFLLLRASPYDIPAAYRWLSGSLNGVQMTSIPKLFIIVIISGSVIILLGRHLRILELGEDSAITLGVRTDLVRLSLVISAVFLIAFATSITGPIAFVAFLSGPIATRLVGSGVPNELPSGLVGAILVLGADMIGQSAFQTRFPVGVITGILGSPYLLILLIQMNRRGGAA